MRSDRITQGINAAPQRALLHALGAGRRGGNGASESTVGQAARIGLLEVRVQRDPLKLVVFFIQQ